MTTIVTETTLDELFDCSTRIVARTPEEKKALAAILAVQDPEFLALLQAVAATFGPAEAVAYTPGAPK